MSDVEKTREELLAELATLRKVIASHEAGKKLRESEETVRALLNAPIDAALLVELDGTVVTLNERAAKARYGSVEELVGQDAFSFFTSELAVERNKIARQVVDSGKPVRRVDQREGRWFDNTVYPVFDASGSTVVRFAIYSRDITEERATAEALKNSESTAWALLNAPHDTAFLVEPDGTILALNEQAARGFNSTMEELKGRNVFDYFPPDVIDQRKPHGEEVQQTGKPVRRVDQRDGRWYDYTIYPIHDAAGEKVVRFAIFARDITEQREMESARKDSEEKYRNLVEQSQQGIVVLADRQIVFANSAFAGILGFTVPELMAMDPGAMRAIIHADDQEAELFRITAIQSGSEGPTTQEFRIIRKDGAVRWVRVLASAVDFGGRLAAQGIFLDIDDSKWLEQRIVQAHKMEAVGRLAGGVAHDFNNLLTAILGYGRALVRKMDPDDPLHENAREICYAADRAATLTRQLLAFSREQKMKPKLFDINGVVHNMEKMLTSLIGPNIQVNIRLSLGLGLVKADPGQLDQVLMNLVLNARDAMIGGGTLTIETSRVELDAEALSDNPDARPGAYVLLAVRDTGSGLDQKQQRHIFEPFFSTKGLGEGTGLGLSVVYGIVRQHGGVITVESEKERGSCFCVFLPLGNDRPDNGVREARPSLPATSEGKRVLVVEDEMVVQRFVTGVLREYGYEVAAASSAEEAERDYADQLENIDILLSDIMLPGRSGIHLVKEFTAIRPDLAVVLASGYAVKESELNFVRVSNYQYLEKPFTEEALIASVRLALEQTSPGSSTE